MDLEEFVEKTLLSITEGVTKAQSKTRLYIAPGFVENEKVVEPQMVRFEVSVTTGREAGGGIKVLSFGDAKAMGRTEHRNTISFQVPVYFQAPTPLNDKHHTRQSATGGGGGDFDDGSESLGGRRRHIKAEAPK